MPEPLIADAVRVSLDILRQHAIPGFEYFGLSRTAARLLNSFEPDRMQTRAFVGVQNPDTIQHYSDRWTRLILFLLRIRGDQEQALWSTLTANDDSLAAGVQAIENAVRGLHAVVDFAEFSFPDCVQRPNPGAKGYDQAERLQKAIEHLSYLLTFQIHDQSPYRLGVVVYAACWAMTPQGTWVAAVRYRPFLSAMIHCMQLWLLGYCMQQRQQPGPQPTLTELVQARCKTHLVNTSEGPIAQLSFWRLICNKAGSDAVQHPHTTVTQDCMQINHGPLELRLDSWRSFLQQLLAEASLILEEELLLAVKELPRYPIAALHDDPTQTQPGKSFLDNPRNDSILQRDALFAALHATPQLKRRFFTRPVEPSATSLCGKKAAINEYFRNNDRFLQLLAALIYMTAGLPPRRKELLGIRWCNQEIIRNIFIENGIIRIITGYHKSQWKIGTRPVARFLPPKVGSLLIHYLLYIPPVLAFFSHCMQWPYRHGLLFSSQGTVWAPDKFSGSLKYQTGRILGDQIKPRQWRHIAIAMDRRLLQAVGCQTYQISREQALPHVRDSEDSDSDLDTAYNTGNINGSFGTASGAHYLQAAHSSRTNREVYGNDSGLSGLTDNLLSQFRTVSFEWHRLSDMQSLEAPACGQKRPVSSSAMESRSKRPHAVLGMHSHREVRQALRTWPVLLAGLKSLFGPEAQPKDCMQREAYRAFVHCEAEQIIVMPTGSGKSVLYLAASCLPHAASTIVILPLISLRQDLIRRCRESPIHFWHFNPADAGRMHERLHTAPPLILVDIDFAVADQFYEFALHAAQGGRLDRIVLEEAHLILTSSDYRGHLLYLGRLRRIQVPFIALTATLPLIGESDFRSLLAVPHAPLYRCSSDRPNLSYCVQRLPAASPGGREGHRRSSNEDRLLLHAVELCQTDLRMWRRSGQPHNRGLCFVRTKAMGLALAEAIGSSFYHGQLLAVERETILQQWYSGRGSPFLTATTSITAGLDYPAVRRTIHLDAPGGMTDFAQQSGRAGRDGLHADCTVLLPIRWKVAWDTLYRTDFLLEDEHAMTLWLTTKLCRRQVLTAFLDGTLHGRGGTACKQDPAQHRAPCDNCMQDRESNPVPYQPPDRPGTSQSHPLPTATPPPFQQGPFIVQCPSPARGSFDAALAPEPPAAPGPVTACNLPRFHSPPAGQLSAAAHYERLSNQAAVKAEGLYLERMQRWQPACILCSFARRTWTAYPHPDCMQTQHEATIWHVRRTPKMDQGIGCFRCGQPKFICQGYGSQRRCQFPWVFFHIIWASCMQDRSFLEDLLQILGGPQLHAVEGTIDPGFLVWAGRKRSGLFRRRTACNGIAVCFFWLDRLEALCGHIGNKD